MHIVEGSPAGALGSADATGHMTRLGMAKAFVHGNPETAAIWRALEAALARRGVDDIVLLSPPGFGAPMPATWPATQVAYRDWLIAELEELGGSVDLVGHDWGAGHTYGVLAERPDLLRSWAADCAGLVHATYVWHNAAQLWQTPGAGEESVQRMIGGELADRIDLLQDLGLPGDVAGDVAAEQNDEMAACILDLYRAAAQPAMADLGRRLATTPQRPGLVIIPTADPYAGAPASAAEVATSLGAETFVLEGLGHWWMFEGADAAADALVRHWEGAG